MLTTIDLEINKEYYAQLVRNGKIRRIRFLGIVNTHRKPEICFQQITKKKNDWHSYNFYGLNEIGIGKTPTEAGSNYGKIVDTGFQPVYLSDEEILKDFQKLRISPQNYDYFNMRNVVTIR